MTGSNNQKNQVYNQSQQQAQQGAKNYQQSYDTASGGYGGELADPGYTDAEKQGMTQATTGSLAGAFGAARDRLQAGAARTGNTAGTNATEEQLALQQGRQNAQALGELQGQFADKRIQGQQNALAGEAGLAGQAGNYANENEANAGKMATTPGFWGRVLGSVLAGGARGGA
jgi:hypothetical protein